MQGSSELTSSLSLLLQAMTMTLRLRQLDADFAQVQL